MGKTNRKPMQISKEILSEKNYEGTRLIEITDETVISLNNQRKELLKEGEPILKEMEKLSPPLDAFYIKLKPIEEERAKIKEEMQPAYDAYHEKVEEMDKVYQKGQLVSNKMQPLINAIVKPQLGEFETAKTMLEKDGKLFVEVVDEIEEKVKAIRANKK
jgi:predicted nuclease with TOPRIM domain